MEFRFSAEALAFEREVQEFLAREWDASLRKRVAATGDSYELERGFRAKLAERGRLTLSWPQKYGGQERSYEEQYLFQEALNYVGAPTATVAVQQVGPTLMAYGSAEQQASFLPRIARGEIEFALGYTEPDVGTDLASLQLRAIRDGDDYVLNGIKRFTSAAHRAEYVWLAARTDPAAPKHRGISMFLVDLATPGITVKPIWTMSGSRTNEVYWDDVRIPADALVGEENRGWYYAAHASTSSGSRSSRCPAYERCSTRSWAGPGSGGSPAHAQLTGARSPPRSPTSRSRSRCCRCSPTATSG